MDPSGEAGAVSAALLPATLKLVEFLKGGTD
jgi:hypothetical protein